MINAPGARGSALISALPDFQADSSSTQALCPSQIIVSNGDASIPRDQEVSDVSVSTDQLGADAANVKRALTLQVTRVQALFLFHKSKQMLY